MKLIVGLGNPGKQYAETRHNLGFMVVGRLAQELGIKWATQDKSFQAEVAEYSSGADKIILVKPLTFMNLSGSSIMFFVHFYKVAVEDVWVVHDELDVPFGELRVKQGGGDAGHNGLGSITAAIGPDYWRFRLGIGGETLRNPIEPVDYVLQNFTPDEQKNVPQVIAATVGVLTQLVSSGDIPQAGNHQLIA